MPADRFALLLPALLLPSFVSGCGSACDVGVLQAKFAAELDPAAAAAAVGESCKSAPAPLLAWLAKPESAPAPDVEAEWRSACSSGPSLAEVYAGPRLASRRTAFEKCGIGESGLATRDEFIGASGQPFLAVSVGAWLRSEGVETALAGSVTRALLGPSAISFPAGVSVELSKLPGSTPLRSAPHLVLVTDGVYVDGKEVMKAAAVADAEAAEASPWQVKALVEAAGPAAQDWVLAAVPASSSHALYRVALSVTASGGTVRLLGATDDGYVSLPLHLVSPSEAREHLSADEPLSGLVAKLAAESVAIELSPGPAPCATAPAGMRCVPGGPVSLGEGAPSVNLSTFYLDEQEATGAEWAACVAGSSCTKLKAPADPAAAIRGMSWTEADHFCTWSGKVLPTEWQWARAGASGVNGLTDLASDTTEWTDTWSTAKPESCGASCTGIDPLGPCDGATPCAASSQKVLRGGAGARAAAAFRSRTAGAGVRCATPNPWLTRFPARLLTDAPPDPTPLTPEQLAIMRGITEDPIGEKPVCEGDWGTVTLTCRDPLTYVKSNEGRSWVMSPYIRNRGGAYVGVGSDQNYTFASLARAQFVFLFDYDPDVVALHMVNRALILASDTPKAFAARYSAAGRAESLKIIAEAYADSPEKEYFLSHYRRFQPHLVDYYSWLTGPSGHEEVQWLRSPEQYAYVRAMWQTGRMWPVKGDLLGKNAMQSIGEACRKLGVPMRTVYVSNAPEVWGGRLVPGYRKNLMSLPADDRSIMIHTFKLETGYGGPTGPWHFNLQSLLQHQELMGRPGYMYVGQLIARRLRTDDIDLTLSGLRSD